MAASPKAATREPAAPALAPDPAAEPPTPCIGVLLVHGAGDHATGSTLIEFGEALIGWVDGWLRRGRMSENISGDRARPGTTQILVREGDQPAPAHAYLQLRPRNDRPKHTWLLAESHWDDAFTPPGFQQVLLWAIGIVPWFLLTQFMGPLARRAKLVPPTLPGVAGYLWRVVVAAITALLLTGVVVAIAILTVVLSLIPSDAVRSVVSSLQRLASTGVGDLYMVLTSTVQRAALTGAVQRDIDWLRARGCTKIAVIAHSQGGYVTYQALTDPWHRKVELLITFGSALIRLTEAQHARRTSVLPFALAGAIGALLALRYLPSTLMAEAGLAVKGQFDELLFAIGLALSGLLVVVLWRYFHTESRIADLPTRIPWFDFLTTEDPVMNRRREGILPARVVQVRTQKQGSLIADHGSYWLNVDEFVSRVALHVGGLDPDLDLPAIGPEETAAKTAALITRATELRHRRVAALRIRGSVVVAGTAALIAALLFRPGQLDSIGSLVAGWFAGLPDFIQTFIPSVLQTLLPIEGIETQLLGAVVLIVLSGLLMSVGSRSWNGWSANAATAEFKGAVPPPSADPVPPAGPAIRFYAWTFLHLVLLTAVAIVGPIAIIDRLQSVAGQRDEVVQAWARQFAWALAVGLIALVIVQVRLPRFGGNPSLGEARWRIGGGIALALAVELVVAIVNPGAMAFPVAVALGAGLAVVLVVLTWLLWPALRGLLDRIAAWVEVDREPATVFDPPASVFDYLGFIGFLVTAVGLVLVIVVPSLADQGSPHIYNEMHLYRAGAILGLAGAIAGIFLVTNRRGIQVPNAGRGRLLFARAPRVTSALARMVTQGSSLGLRIVGALAVVIGVAVFAWGLVRAIQLGGPID
jgi:hypothetical protein